MPDSLAEQFILEFLFLCLNTRVWKKKTQLCLAQHKTAPRAAEEPAPPSELWTLPSGVEPDGEGQGWVSHCWCSMECSHASQPSAHLAGPPWGGQSRHFPGRKCKYSELYCRPVQCTKPWKRKKKHTQYEAK